MIGKIDEIEYNDYDGDGDKNDDGNNDEYEDEYDNEYDDEHNNEYEGENENINNHVMISNNEIGVNSKNTLQISWGPAKSPLIEPKETKKTFTFSSSVIKSSIIDPDHPDEYMFENHDKKTKIIYNTSSDHVWINDHKIMSHTELNDLMEMLKKEKKVKNIQMIKNMMYYAKGIPEFIIGINDYKSGIIAFFKKNNNYYDRYFYDNPWTDDEMRKNTKDEEDKRKGEYSKLISMNNDHLLNYCGLHLIPIYLIQPSQ